MSGFLTYRYLLNLKSFAQEEQGFRSVTHALLGRKLVYLFSGLYGQQMRNNKYGSPNCQRLADYTSLILQKLCQEEDWGLSHTFTFLLTTSNSSL